MLVSMPVVPSSPPSLVASPIPTVLLELEKR
jgi:hypothetical protein